MSRYLLSPEAKTDLLEIRAHLEEEAGVRVARHVLGELSKAMRFLARTPGAGHKREYLTDEAVKFWPVFSYLIVYDPQTPIGIARVLHAAQDVAFILQPKPSS